ncbi:Proteophosphoglycan ppg4 [Rhodotorula diobovata]|uniref:Proteophosphoglycan ppg4 n=1 Tax=Rhodotorula diobovata TaxID=5288 RepID=A0A5C5FZ82_9BASI|nr:Proteophosphoglycan ppg4 [Rhodotorula diobovata]
MSRSPDPQLRPPRPADDNPGSGSDSGSNSAEDEQEEVYEVEAVRASRYDESAGAMRYFIKWKGYGEDEKTWEPIEASPPSPPHLRADGTVTEPRSRLQNLQNCLELVKEFERNQADIKRRIAEKQAATSGAKRDKSPAKKAPRRDCASDDSEVSVELSLKKFDERREKAKKAKANEKRPNSRRAETDVADKWEKKAEKKARQSEPVASTSKGRAATRPSTKKRPTDDETPSATAKKAKKARKIADDSESSSEVEIATRRLPKAAATKAPAPAKPVSAMSNGSASPAAPPAPQPDNDAAGVLPAAASTPAPAAAPAPAKHPATTSTPSTVSRTSAEPAAAKPQPRKSTGLQGPYATLNAIKAIAFKKAPPPPPPPAPLPAPSAATGSPIEGSSSGTRVRFANGPGAPAPPRAAAQPQPAHSALRQTAAQPALRAPTPQPAAAPPAAAAEKVTPAALPATAAASPAAASPPDEADAGKSEAEIAEAAAKQAEADRTRRLVEMERRLRATSWCGKDPRFEQEALPVACAKAIPIDAPLVRRLKSKGVAVLFSNREDTMGGEGLALGYLLMSMGAVTPDKLEGVEAVFIHRNDSFAQLEALYAELVNLPSHAVEFFRFGGGEPVEDIFRAGYLVLPTLAALRHAASYERFCSSVRDVYARTCQMFAHPATVAYLRSLPNWFTIVARLGTTGVEIIDRDELPLSSAFAGTEKSTLMAPAASWPSSIPQVEATTELSEIISHVAHTRFKYPATWRRFVIVVDDIKQGQRDQARKRGIELATWESLTDLIKAAPFG